MVGGDADWAYTTRDGEWLLIEEEGVRGEAVIIAGWDGCCWEGEVGGEGVAVLIEGICWAEVEDTEEGAAIGDGTVAPQETVWWTE